MTTWELGGKTSWEAAGTLIANGALFFNDYTDKQVGTQVLSTCPDPPIGPCTPNTLQPRVDNAAAAQVLGIEVDLNWFPAAIDGLRIRLAYTWQDATYTDYINETQSPLRTSNHGSCPVVNVALPDKEPILFCALDYSGNDMERQARNAFSGNIGYVRPLPNSPTEWFVESDASFTGKRYLEQDNYNYFDAFWLVNFRLGLQADKWDVLVFLDNALDDDTFRTGGPGPDFALQNTRLGFTGGLGVNGYFGIMPQPRTLGLRSNFRFGD
jgi:outer membrane receptor protein involved in Fe transport